MAWISEFWKEHSKGIAASVVTAATLGAIHFLMGWQWLKAMSAMLADHLGGDMTMRRYWVPVGIGATLLFSEVARRLPGILRQGPSYYRRDEVFGVLWEWGDQEYTGDDGLRAFCPDCQGKVYLNDTPGGLECVCACCSFRLAFPQADAPVCRTAVGDEIERRRRTGEWRQARKRLRRLTKKRKKE